MAPVFLLRRTLLLHASIAFHLEIIKSGHTCAQPFFPSGSTAGARDSAGKDNQRFPSPSQHVPCHGTRAAPLVRPNKYPREDLTCLLHRPKWVNSGHLTTAQEILLPNWELVQLKMLDFIYHTNRYSYLVKPNRPLIIPRTHVGISKE